ncbi:hypothetical protein EUGRSUZ_F04227 [Eucalyptus grandis]|uniref:Uncharacterized protein n=4 Tax=Eucalyptus grandis TaxID=71139 RepID=A0A059BYU7_EUCGR|nr:hypothetical protein EUGRSUZ_F04227 [Eucalyptus grandis]KAK3428112.1 hypothetical protein EUGRSUZ_F04227 [Eucalyptus grandis]KAK3428113.1 hypothetical protein EUGRSUZ_F04227 [Eucalyptus grandis]
MVFLCCCSCSENSKPIDLRSISKRIGLRSSSTSAKSEGSSSIVSLFSGGFRCSWMTPVLYNLGVRELVQIWNRWGISIWSDPSS